MLTQAKGKDSPNAACINAPKKEYSATHMMSPCLLVLFDYFLYVSTVERIQLPILDIQLFFAFLVPPNNLTNIFYRPAWPKAFPPPVARTTPNRILLSRKGVTTIWELKMNYYMHCLGLNIFCYHLPLLWTDLFKHAFIIHNPMHTLVYSLCTLNKCMGRAGITVSKNFWITKNRRTLQNNSKVLESDRFDSP